MSDIKELRKKEAYREYQRKYHLEYDRANKQKIKEYYERTKDRKKAYYLRRKQYKQELQEFLNILIDL